MEHGLDLVVVDYLQLMSSGDQGREPHPGGLGDLPRPEGGRQAAQRPAARALAALAQPGAARATSGPSSPTCASRARSSRTPTSWSSSTARTAPCQAAGGPEEEEDWRLAEIIIAKQRNGPTDMFKLVYLEEFTRFENPEFVDQ